MLDCSNADGPRTSCIHVVKQAAQFLGDAENRLYYRDTSYVLEALLARVLDGS